jgi:hypothetical protein
MKRLIMAALLIAAVGAVILSRFPSAATCRASGRVVDPTGRHCLDATGYVQLREHVIFHTQEVLVLLALAGALIWGYRFLRRRGSRPSA